MTSEKALEQILETSHPDLGPETILKLVDYFALVIKWNRRISLTTVTAPREFAVRHLGEAIFAAGRLKNSIRELWDIGSGLGIPGIPVAILRPDLDVRLVESNKKKAIFLEEAIDALGLARVKVINERFENLAGFSTVSCLSARAVDRMEAIVRLVLQKGEAAGQLLIFAGPDIQLGEVRKCDRYLLPGSTERFLYDIS